MGDRGRPGLHCLSAFTVFLTATDITQLTTRGECLHCLSAFTVFLTNNHLRLPPEFLRSPLPFGIHRVPDASEEFYKTWWSAPSPLPFGIHRVPDPPKDEQHHANHLLTFWR